MSKIKGIYAASMSILDNNLSLNIEKTIKHSEKIIDQGCHGVAIFGSTGQAQLISVSEKINLLNHLSNSKYKDKYLIGTGLNSPKGYSKKVVSYISKLTGINSCDCFSVEISTRVTLSSITLFIVVFAS